MKMINYWLLSKLRAKQMLPQSFFHSMNKIRRLSLLRRFRSEIKLSIIKRHKGIRRQDLKLDLINMGLTPGMKVMVHSSLSGIGHVEGGAPTVIEALIEIIGPNGLLIMPCPPTSGSTMEAIKRKELFNPETTPCTTGIICETFRRGPGVFRSYHPTHSIAAFGKNASWLVKDHHLDETPFGPKSPFARLLELDGYVLGIGLDTRWMTIYHHFEDMNEGFPIKVYSNEKYKLPVLVKDGSQISVSTSHHDSAVSGVRLNNDSATLMVIDDALTRFGEITRSTVGLGSGYLIKADRIMYTLGHILKTENQTIYNQDLLRKIKPDAIKKQS